LGEPIVGVTLFVGNPLFVDFFVHPREDAHHFGDTGVRLYVGASRVHDVDCVVRL
jgi:hypothetical protein